MNGFEGIYVYATVWIGFLAVLFNNLSSTKIVLETQIKYRYGISLPCCLHGIMQQLQYNKQKNQFNASFSESNKSAFVLLKVGRGRGISSGGGGGGGGGGRDLSKSITTLAAGMSDVESTKTHNMSDYYNLSIEDVIGQRKGFELFMEHLGGCLFFLIFFF